MFLSKLDFIVFSYFLAFYDLVSAGFWLDCKLRAPAPIALFYVDIEAADLLGL